MAKIKKRTTYFHTAVTPFKIDKIPIAGRDLKRAGADLSKTYIVNEYITTLTLGTTLCSLNSILLKYLIIESEGPLVA